MTNAQLDQLHFRLSNGGAIVDAVQALCDDAAAAADVRELDALLYDLAQLAKATKLRRDAVAERLAGEIETALWCEEQADEIMRGL